MRARKESSPCGQDVLRCFAAGSLSRMASLGCWGGNRLPSPSKAAPSCTWKLERTSKGQAKRDKPPGAAWLTVVVWWLHSVVGDSLAARGAGCPGLCCCVYWNPSNLPSEQSQGKPNRTKALRRITPDCSVDLKSPLSSFHRSVYPEPSAARFA